MRIEFSKIIQFSLLIKTGDRVREFNFRKLKSPDEEQLTVNVCDDRGDRVFFLMQKNEGNWRITSNNPPLWVTQNENKIRQAVEEELSHW